MILGVDAGNSNVKIFGQRGAKIFPSALGEFRERKLKQTFTEDDIIYEFNGKKGFAGTLAQYESQFTSSRMGGSKAHEEMLIRVLLGLHRYSTDNEYSIVVGQPISNHTDSEKQKMKELLQGSHVITVNDDIKTINIKRAEIAAEGGSAFWSNPQKGIIRVLDIGSGTVNGATLNDGRYIDKHSFTIIDGLETLISNDIEGFSRKICLYALRYWEIDDTVLLCGGGAVKLIEYINEYFTNVSLLKPATTVRNESGGMSQKQLDPIYANAVGFYNIAKKVLVDG